MTSSNLIYYPHFNAGTATCILIILKKETGFSLADEVISPHHISSVLAHSCTLTYRSLIQTHTLIIYNFLWHLVVIL